MKINLINDISCTQRITADKYEQEFKNAPHLCGTAHVAKKQSSGETTNKHN